MEVLVVGAKGVSPDSVVSIRAAGTRRQGPFSSTPGKPFKFPCTAEECTSIKVDVFAPVGTARAMCLKGVVRDCTLPLQAPAGHEGVLGAEGVRLPWEKVERVQKQVSIQVRPAGDAPPLSPEEQDGQEQTAGYFEEHGLLVFLQGLLQDLIKDRPAAPFDYISHKALAFQPAPVPQPQVAEVAAPLLEEAPAATDPEATPLNDLKREAHEALLRGASTGELKQILQSMRSKESVRARPTEEESEEEEAPPKEEPQEAEDEDEPKVEESPGEPTKLEEPPVEEEPTKVEEAPVEEEPEAPAQVEEPAAEEAVEEAPVPQEAAAGEATAFEERLSPGETVPDEPVPEAAQKAAEPSTSGTPPAPQGDKTQESEIERIRKEMRQALLQGVQNGGLQKALEDCHPEHPAEVRTHQETAPPVEELEEPVVDPVQEPPMDDLRGRARDALLESASGGHLDKVLAELRPSSRERSAVQPVPVPASVAPSSVGTFQPLYSELAEMAKEAEKLSNQVKEMKELVLQAAQENEKLRADLAAAQRSASTTA